MEDPKIKCQLFIRHKNKPSTADQVIVGTVREIAFRILEEQKDFSASRVEVRAIDKNNEATEKVLMTAAEAGKISKAVKKFKPGKKRLLRKLVFLAIPEIVYRQEQEKRRKSWYKATDESTYVIFTGACLARDPATQVPIDLITVQHELIERAVPQFQFSVAHLDADVPGKENQQTRILAYVKAPLEKLFAGADVKLVHSYEDLIAAYKKEQIARRNRLLSDQEFEHANNILKVFHQERSER